MTAVVDAKVAVKLFAVRRFALLIPGVTAEDSEDVLKALAPLDVGPRLRLLQRVREDLRGAGHGVRRAGRAPRPVHR